MYQNKAKMLPFLIFNMRSEILPDLHLHTWLSISSWKHKPYTAYVFIFFYFINDKFQCFLPILLCINLSNLLKNFWIANVKYLHVHGLHVHD